MSNTKADLLATAFIYMSKASGDINSYGGDGEWFKIWESGPTGEANVDENWGTWQAPSIEGTIPTGIADGDYLVRVSVRP